MSDHAHYCMEEEEYAARKRDLRQYTEYVRKEGGKLHYFGLGFIQIKQTDTFRTHYYFDDLDPILDEEEAHDHRYGFTSNVLIGSLLNKMYYYEPVEESGWELCEVKCTEGELPKS